jgi:hypothetical protein
MNLEFSEPQPRHKYFGISREHDFLQPPEQHELHIVAKYTLNLAPMRQSYEVCMYAPWG